MRNRLLLTIGFFAATTFAAQAVPLKDCSHGSANKRIACLQENIILLNKSYETVTAELRNGVAGLNTKTDVLTNQVSETKGELPDFTNTIIQWKDHENSCIVYMGNNLLQIRDTCTDENRNRFVIRTYKAP